jgi:NAD(P)-dependent dehydrogenase (short-subunit alcohol dehydrogenase family)
MSERLTGRRILITGAAGGMGRSIAEVFSREQAAVALLDQNATAVHQVADQIGAIGYSCDVRSKTDVETAVRQAAEHMGGLDGIVSAAGVLMMKPFAALEAGNLENMMNVNFWGPCYLIKAALPHLQAAATATIVNIVSVSAYLPMMGTSGYSASKSALLMLTKCLALELGPAIRCNAICPGVIQTEMTRHIWESPEHAARAAERTALKRIGSPKEIAAAALYLSSSESGFITGTEIVVDGGFSWR